MQRLSSRSPSSTPLKGAQNYCISKSANLTQICTKRSLQNSPFPHSTTSHLVPKRDLDFQQTRSAWYDSTVVPLKNPFREREIIPHPNTVINRVTVTADLFRDI